ncbi:hypothetical protein J6590_018724 [Homalodisca vitripennis]|nr:hypothetical protein J6590_018724 [Homalodisca vitripennis]
MGTPLAGRSQPWDGSCFVSPSLRLAMRLSERSDAALMDGECFMANHLFSTSFISGMAVPLVKYHPTLTVVQKSHI